MAIFSSGFLSVFQQKTGRPAGKLNQQSTSSLPFQGLSAIDCAQLRFGGNVSRKANEILIPLSLTSEPQEKTIVRDPQQLTAMLTFQKDKTGGLVLRDESASRDDSLELVTLHQIIKQPSGKVIFRGDKIRWRNYQFVLVQKPGGEYFLNQIPVTLDDKTLQRLTNVNQIGREQGANHIVVDGPNVSRKHAVILEFANQGAFWMDLEPTNATYYGNEHGGEQLQPYTYAPLVEGRRIFLGDTTYQVYRNRERKLELTSDPNNLYKALWVEGQ